MTQNVATYFSEGCGRCPLGGTPQCNVHKWQEELMQLRAIFLDSGLTETVKWGQPCYTFENGNVVIMSVVKYACVMGFFKGALLKDLDGILTKPGENSQAVRQIRFTNVRELIEMEPILRAYIQEAIELEKAGMKVKFKKNPEPIPIEFQNKLDNDPALKTAFEALTPGRQRGYILHFSQPKQSKTRESRIEKCREKILSGKGFHDR